MRGASSVAVGIARWRAVFLAGFVTLFLLKLMLAATLSPFGDEAFCWRESRRLARGYGDLPPLTVWLIRPGETVPGRVLAREQFDEETGWRAGAPCALAIRPQR